MKNYYDILGVLPSSSPEDIKKAYKQKCFETHPDRNDGKNEEFLKVQEAYEIITGKRKDRSVPHYPDYRDVGFDINDFMQGFGFGHHAQGSGFKRSQMPPQHDSEIGLQLSICVEDIRKGKEFELEYQKSKPCSYCNGVGGTEKNKCSTCNGRGMIQNVQQNGNSYHINSYGCPNCGGRGEIIKNPCSHCNTSGFVVYSEKIKFEIKEKY